MLLLTSYLKPYLIDCPIIIELFEMLTLLNASFDEQWHINICYEHVICLADIKKCQARIKCIEFWIVTRVSDAMLPPLKRHVYVI